MKNKYYFSQITFSKLLMRERSGFGLVYNEIILRYNIKNAEMIDCHYLMRTFRGMIMELPDG